MWKFKLYHQDYTDVLMQRTDHDLPEDDTIVSKHLGAVK